MSYIIEDYSTIKSLFDDPKFKNTNVYDALMKFKDDGGTILGSGAFGIVLTNKNWNFVLKIFIKDDSYLRFVRFALKHNRVSYPKFFDIPRKIKVNLKSKVGEPISQLYLVKMEKLNPITKNDFDNIMFYFRYKTKNSNFSSPPKIYSELARIEAKYKSIKHFNDDFIFLMRNIKNIKKSTSMDLHEDNVMRRTNGELVIIDPFYDHSSAEYF